MGCFPRVAGMSGQNRVTSNQVAQSIGWPTLVLSSGLIMSSGPVLVWSPQEGRREGEKKKETLTIWKAKSLHNLEQDNTETWKELKSGRCSELFKHQSHTIWMRLAVYLTSFQNQSLLQGIWKSTPNPLNATLKARICIQEVLGGEFGD